MHAECFSQNFARGLCLLRGSALLVVSLSMAVTLARWRLAMWHAAPMAALPPRQTVST